MPYHIFIPNEMSSEKYLIDLVVGSATKLEFYWESVARKLQLPMIASISKHADSEGGFRLSGDAMQRFQNELRVLERYWMEDHSQIEKPEQLIVDIRKLHRAIDIAIEQGFSLYCA